MNVPWIKAHRVIDISAMGSGATSKISDRPGPATINAADAPLSVAVSRLEEDVRLLGQALSDEQASRKAEAARYEQELRVQAEEVTQLRARMATMEEALEALRRVAASTSVSPAVPSPPVDAEMAAGCRPISPTASKGLGSRRKLNLGVFTTKPEASTASQGTVAEAAPVAALPAPGLGAFGPSTSAEGLGEPSQSFLPPTEPMTACAFRTRSIWSEGESLWNRRRDEVRRIKSEQSSLGALKVSKVLTSGEHVPESPKGAFVPTRSRTDVWSCSEFDTVCEEPTVNTHAAAGPPSASQAQVGRMRPKRGKKLDPNNFISSPS